ncbi:MAG TPA: TlpA disulfide reductase family protein [Clostridia bacterium]|nr:TlpA disulfide reductase family protein [Clostridia bacterium]
MTEPRPTFRQGRERRGLVGPFSGRQLVTAFGVVIVAIVVLVVATTPLGSTAGGGGLVDPKSTPFVIGAPPAQGLRVGDAAPEVAVPLEDGSTYQLTDLDGRPIRLADLRGKAVWINFWASWCPPCQGETPVLRDLAERYRDRGLELVAISVQETAIDDVRDYAERYELGYTIGFDGSGHVFRSYRVYALPTQFFLDVNGVIRYVVQGPLDEEGARQRIERLLPAPSASLGP